MSRLHRPSCFAPLAASAVLVVAALPLCGCLIVIDDSDGQHGSSFWDDRYERSWTDEIDSAYLGEASSVSVTSRAGDVTVRYAEGRASVETKAFSSSQRRIDELVVSARVNGDGVLEIEPDWNDGWKRGDRCHLVVTLPERMSITAETKAGDIEVTGMTGHAEAVSAAGDVEVHDHDGDVHAESQAGDVLVRDASGSVQASTNAGDIDLERVGWPIEASTSAGDVSVSMHHGFSGLLRASTSAGSISLPGEVEMYRAGSTRKGTARLGSDDTGDTQNECVFRSSAGDITVRELAAAN